MEVLISNPDLEFRNSNPQIIFWANLSRKSQSWPFCLKIGIHGILEELILHPDLVFQNSDHKIHFWANLDRKIQNWPSENWHTWYRGGADSASEPPFSKFQPQNPFLGKFGLQKSNLSIVPENWYTEYFKDADSYSDISFSEFPTLNLFFGKVWDKKVKAVCFAMKTGTHTHKHTHTH